MASDRGGWLHQHWPSLAALAVSALFLYLQLVVWKKQGADLMLTAATIVITAFLWIILIFAIGRYWKIARRARRSIADLAAEKEPHVEEIRRLSVQHESEEFRSRQIRDEALAEARTAKERIAELEGQLAEAKQHVVEPPDDLPVTLRPAKGLSPEQFLIVTNNGERQGFRGRCTVFEGSSPENATNTFGLKWESGDAEVYLARGESRKLLIARAWQDRPYQLEYICLCTDAAPANDEVLMGRWNIGEKPTIVYRLEISIFGKKTQTFHKQQFTVRQEKSLPYKCMKYEYKDGWAGGPPERAE